MLDRLISSLKWKLASLILMTIISVSLASGAEYSHSFDTFDFSVSTNLGLDIDWRDSDGGLFFANLPNGKYFSVYNSDFHRWEPQDTSEESLIEIWSEDADEGENKYSIPTIYQLSNGDYVITGRMIRWDNMITKSERTFDFDGDGLLDWHTGWVTDGKYDYNIITDLANETRVVLIVPDWD